jgi:hypothetical protein
MKASFGVVVALALALGVVGAPASIRSAQTDPRVGSWKLNIEKSTFDPGPPLKSDMRTYEAEGGGVKATFKLVSQTGDVRTSSYSAKYDGKDYPFRGTPNFDTIAIKSVDASTQEVTLKKDGKVVQNQRIVFSQGGKVMTITAKGITASGQPLTNVLVFDKQ